MVRCACCCLVAVLLAMCPARAEDAGPVLTPPAELTVPQDPPKVVPRVLDLATPENTRIIVSLGRQRVYLRVGDEVAIDAPVSTGKRRAQTPAGDYRILEKSATHASNQHGDFVDPEGRPVRQGVSTRVDPAPSGTVFVVVPVQYHLRLDEAGLALHAGRLPGYPAADTAVRLPADVAPLVYQRVKTGTPVTIEE